MFKWLLIAAGSIALAGSAFFVWGASLPRDHMARSAAVVPQPADDVLAKIKDVEGYPTWRAGVARVDIVATDPLRWRETTQQGALTFERIAMESPTRLAARVIDDGQGFGGTWTYEVVSESASSTRVTITEEGYVDSALFRAVSAMFFDPHATMNAFLVDLGAAFGADVALEELD